MPQTVSALSVTIQEHAHCEVDEDTLRVFDAAGEYVIFGSLI